MDLRSRGRKLSFDILSDLDSSSPIHHPATFSRSNSDPVSVAGYVGNVDNRNRKKNRKKKKKKQSTVESPTMNSIAECATPFPESIDDCNPSEESRLGFSCHNYISRSGSGVVCQELGLPDESVATVSQVWTGELRQRNVGVGAGAGSVGIPEEEPSSTPLPISVSISWAAEIRKEESSSLTKPRSDHPNHPFLAETSPFRYFMEEMCHGNSLKSTTILGNEKERERVYDTIFRLPWRCEWLINVGFFVCLNSFLSLFTIMPMRVLMVARRLLNTRETKKLSAAELSDFGCLVVLACGVMLLGRIDISLIYHMIRGQGIVKLYVVYNVLEIFDKLGQSISGDILETLFCSADGLASCPPESFRYWVKRYIIDLIGAAATSIVHSFILLAQAITLSTCIVAHNNALLALLVSNNFSEIKSNVFKRFSEDNIHIIAYADSVERFHISAFLLFVLAQNILEAEGSWFGKFLSNALVVYLCEIAIDILKHSFMAKFNDIKPVAYSEFLEDLCRQTLNLQTEGGIKRLSFVPLASASVVIRVLTPVYAAYVPSSSLPWRLLWIFFLALLTYVMLVTLKMLVGMALQKHAAWYIQRCQRRKLHSD